VVELPTVQGFSREEVWSLSSMAIVRWAVRKPRPVPAIARVQLTMKNGRPLLFGPESHLAGESQSSTALA